MHHQWAPADLGLASGVEFHILDLGAFPIPADQPHYSRLVDVAPCHLVAVDAITFDPAKILKELPRLKSLNCLYSVIGDGRPANFYECSLPTRSSLYLPCESGTARFDSVSRFMQVVETHSIETTKLDELVPSLSYDLVKMDLQGGELLAIRHGRASLQDSLVVQVEVEFIQQYVNQPLFSDVDLELRTQGFEFHRFLGYGTRPPSTASDIEGTQWLWSDAVYVKRSQARCSLGVEKLRKASLALMQCYGSYDIAISLLEEADTLEGVSFTRTVLDKLRKSAVRAEL